MREFWLLSLLIAGLDPAMANPAAAPAPRVCAVIGPDQRIDFEALSEADARAVDAALRQIDPSGRDRRAVKSLAMACDAGKWTPREGS